MDNIYRFEIRAAPRRHPHAEIPVVHLTFTDPTRARIVRDVIAQEHANLTVRVLTIVMGEELDGR
jgi:hypothetical protein